MIGLIPESSGHQGYRPVLGGIDLNWLFHFQSSASHPALMELAVANGSTGVVVSIVRSLFS
jgi:hypothetical protein